MFPNRSPAPREESRSDRGGESRGDRGGESRPPRDGPGADADNWTSDRQSSEVREERAGGYDGPAGMDPDGIIDSNWDEVTENFDDMNLREELLRGVYAYGFEKPSAIQQRAIVPCVKGHDVIAQAQSGTGKTATFSISILQQIDTKLAQCQVRETQAHKVN